MRARIKWALEAAALMVFLLTFLIPGAHILIATFAVLTILMIGGKEELRRRYRRWRDASNLRVVTCENNGVVGVWFYDDYREALKRQSAKAIAEKKPLTAQLTHVPGGMTFVSSTRYSVFHTGTYGDMKRLLRGCQVEGRTGIFVPFSSGIEGRYEDQFRRYRCIEQKKAKAIFKLQRKTLRRRAGHFGWRAFIREFLGISKLAGIPITA